MSADEYMSLVKEFEETYDPFNSYDSTEETQENKSDDMVSPLWTYGKIEDDKWIEEGCHEYITSSLASFSPMIKGSFPITTGIGCISFYQYPLPPFFPIETRSELRYLKGTFTILTQERAIQTQSQIRQK